MSTFAVTRCRTTSVPPARRPRRTACRKSAAVLRRWLADSTRGHRPQTARLLRPLRRRADRIARPARVRIRRRKPCTLCRRRLFGWYVRLLTSSSPRHCCWDVSTNRVARRRTPPVTRTTGTACPRERPQKSNRRKEPAGARSWTCGTGRTGFDLPTVRGGRRHGQFEPTPAADQPKMTILTGVGHGKSSRHADVSLEPVENRLPGPPGVVSVRAPDTPKNRDERAQSARSRTLHTLWTKVWIGTVDNQT